LWILPSVKERALPYFFVPVEDCCDEYFGYNGSVIQENIMAHDNHSAAPPQVPAEMLAQHRAGWGAFTHGVFYVSVATAAVLVFLLLIGKVF
jgi:hypothetical protein